MTDDSVTKFAQRYRLETAAALVQIIRDESASPTARAPLRADERQQLLAALLAHYECEMPGQFKALMQEEAYEEAAEQLDARSRRPRFERGRNFALPASPVALVTPPGSPLNRRGEVQ